MIKDMLNIIRNKELIIGISQIEEDTGAKKTISMEKKLVYVTILISKEN